MNKIELVTNAIADGDLKQSSVFESGVDRIRALARCDALGAAMVRLMANYSQGTFDSALELLVRRVKPRSKMRPRSIYEKICRLAIMEWIQHSESERMHDSGLDPRTHPKWQPVFAKALREISDSYDRVKRELPRQLANP